jgi:hypothetical protein
MAEEGESVGIIKLVGNHMNLKYEVAVACGASVCCWFLWIVAFKLKRWDRNEISY